MAKTPNEALPGGQPRGSPLSEDRHDLRILYAVRQIIRRIDMDSRKLAAEHRITGPQLVSLITIAEKGPLTATGIARHVHLSASTMVGILDRLESKGLVERHRDARDRRLLYVHATDAGRALVQEAPYPLQYSLQRAFRRLSERQQKQTAASLERLVRLMGADEIEAEPMLKIGPIGKLPDQRERGSHRPR
ncbi:MAG: MarR family transcriptional regulator [Phycisphaerae bacterium]